MKQHHVRTWLMSLGVIFRSTSHSGELWLMGTWPGAFVILNTASMSVPAEWTECPVDVQFGCWSLTLFNTITGQRLFLSLGMLGDFLLSERTLPSWWPLLSMVWCHGVMVLPAGHTAENQTDCKLMDQSIINQSSHRLKQSDGWFRKSLQQLKTNFKKINPKN